MNSKHWMLALIVVLALSLTLSLAVGQAARRATPTAIAVVDVQKAFEALAEKAQLEADLQTAGEKLKTENTERENTLRQMQNDLEVLAVGTPAFNEKQAQLEQRIIELQAWRAFSQQRLERDRSVQMESLYRKMLEAVGRVAKQTGYDLVLFKEPPVNFRGRKAEEISTIVQVRKVLWSSDELDLTDQIIQLMNNEYQNMAQPKN